MAQDRAVRPGEAARMPRTRRHALIGTTPGAAPKAEPVALASADHRAGVLGNRYRTRSDCKGR